MKQKIHFIIIFMILVFLAGCMSDNQPADEVQELTFSLETEFRRYANEEINALLLEEIINSNPDLWNFMVLEPNKPIQDSTFIQVGASWATTAWPFQFNLEIGFGNAETGFRLYRFITEDNNLVMETMIAYWQEQIIPDISSWEDVSYIFN